MYDDIKLRPYRALFSEIHWQFFCLTLCEAV